MAPKVLVPAAADMGGVCTHVIGFIELLHKVALVLL